MPNKPECHPEDASHCEFCRDSQKLVYDAKRHVAGVRAAWMLSFNPDDYTVVLKNALAHFIRARNPKMVKAVGETLATFVKALR